MAHRLEHWVGNGHRLFVTFEDLRRHVGNGANLEHASTVFFRTPIR